MTRQSTPAVLILAAAAVASLMLAPSLAAAAAGQGARMAASARATVANPNRIIRDHRRDAQCKWTGRFYCSPKRPPL